MPMLTDFRFRCIDRVKLADRRDEADIRQDPVVRIVPGGTHDEIVGGRRKTVLVEEARDPWGGHAPPIVGVAVEQAGDHRDLRVAC